VFGDTTDFQAGATQTYGYEYNATAPGSTDTAPPTFNTALNIDTNATPQAFFQVVDSSCVQPGAGAASHAGSHLLLRPEGTR
jgi:hypothetical protein